MSVERSLDMPALRACTATMTSTDGVLGILGIVPFRDQHLPLREGYDIKEPSTPLIGAAKYGHHSDVKSGVLIWLPLGARSLGTGVVTRSVAVFTATPQASLWLLTQGGKHSPFPLYS